VTIESNRKLGGIGSLLMLVGAFGIIFTLAQYAVVVSDTSLPNLGILGGSGVVSMIALVGFFLFLIAMHGFSRNYQEPKIFSNIFRGLVATIVAVIVAGVIWIIVFMANILSMIPTIASSTSSAPITSSQIQELVSPATAIFGAVISLVALVWIFFFYKAFNLLAEKSKVPLFSTAAKIFVLGAVITVVSSIVYAALSANGTLDYTTTALVSVPGSAIQYVAWAIAAKGFFNIKVPPQTEATQTYAPAWTANPAVRYCTHCGAPNQADSVYCTRCGQKMQ